MSYGFDEQGFQAAMELATEQINNRTDILKDYELVVKYANTYVSRKTQFNQYISTVVMRQAPILSFPLSIHDLYFFGLNIELAVSPLDLA